MTKKELNSKIKDEEILNELFYDFKEGKSVKGKKQEGNNANNYIIWIIVSIILLVTTFFIIYNFILNNKEVNNNEISEIPAILDEVIEKKDITDESKPKLQSNTDKNFKSKKIPKDYIFSNSNLFAYLLTDKSWNIKSDENFSNMWGKENLYKSKFGGLKILYPSGSYKPSKDPRGGAGFIYNLDNGFTDISLSYDIELASNFDFVKGGKLPGLCSGDCPRGGMNTDNGFSVTFSWRKNGELSVLSYLPGENKYGTYIKENFFKMVAGNKYKLTMKIKLNNPGKKDGVLIVYVDGKKYLEKTDVLYRNSDKLTIDSLLFITFFGGNDKTYASPNETYIKFNEFKILN